MNNRRKNSRRITKQRRTTRGNAQAQRKLAVNVTEEQDWYLDVPDVRLTRIFAVVILLHLLAVGGIFAFKMVDKASDANGITAISATKAMDSAVQQKVETAVQVPATVPAANAARQPVPAPLRPDPSKAQHKVLAGETLPDIAQQYGITPEALRAKNSIISDNELYPGRYLDLPGKDEVVEAPRAEIVAEPVAEQVAAPAPKPVAQTATQAVAKPVEKPAAAAKTTKGSTYVVKSGDTPWGIARQFNIPFNKLMSANGITNAQSLQIGQKLQIPAAE